MILMQCFKRLKSLKAFIAKVDIKKNLICVVVLKTGLKIVKKAKQHLVATQNVIFNDILIPRFKEAFTLSYFQAMLVQFAFFGAYFIGSLIYFIISITTGDPIAKIGYKNGVVIGLLISATGSTRRRDPLDDIYR